MRRAVVILGLAALVAGSTSAGIQDAHFDARAAPRPLRLIVKPNPVPLGVGIIVIVTGLKPGERVTFTDRPTKPGFGGGLMGRRAAAKDGTIVFSYPAFTKQWEVGTWIITAQLPMRSLTTRLTVTEPPTPVPTPSYPPVANVPRQSLPSSGQPWPIPAVVRNDVAFVTRSCARCRRVLTVGHLAGRTRRRVADVSAANPLTLQLSAHWLVWVAGRYPSSGWRLLGWNRQTHRKLLLASSAIGGGQVGPTLPEISLSGDRLAWVQHGCNRPCTGLGSSTVRVTNLATGTSQVVAHSTDSCHPFSAPMLSPGFLSWVREPLRAYTCRPANSWTIILQDLHTGSRTRRVIRGSGTGDRIETAREFSGYGPWEAWIESRPYENLHQARLIVMNLQTGRSRVIGRGSQDGPESPRLTGQVLAWLQNERVEALDLRTGRRYLLAHGSFGPRGTVDLGFHLGWSWRNKVLWQEQRFGPEAQLRDARLVVATVP